MFAVYRRRESFLRRNNARNDTVLLRVFIPSIYNQAS
jgi:hypothetical protein